MANKRIYVVTDAEGTETLVRAISRAQAIKHMVAGMFTAKAASAEDVARIACDANEVEDATRKAVDDD